MKSFKKYGLRAYIAWSLTVDCVAVCIILWYLLGGSPVAHDYISYHPSSRQIMKFEDRRSSKPSHPGILAPPVATAQIGLLYTNPPPKKKSGRTYLADTIDLDRLIRAESSGKKGQTSSQGAYGLAQFMPETYANWHVDSKITKVPIPKVFKGKKFEEVMDDEGLAKLAAKTYMRMLERYLERAEGLGPEDVTVRNILGSYNVGPTKYRSRIRKRRNFLRATGRRDLDDVPFHLWERWLKVK
jgi:hypothetical protein